MKKFLSIALSLMMLMSAIVTVNAADVAITTDVSSVEGATFAEFMGEDFDEDYFFVGTFAPDEFLANKDAIDASVYLNISTDATETLKLKVVKISADNKEATLISDFEISSGNSVDKHLLNSFGGNPSVFMDNPSRARIGVALMNPEDLAEDAKVAVSLTGYYITASGYSEDDTNKFTYGECEETFRAPVKFDDPALAAFGELLTKLKFGNSIDANDIAKALDNAATSTKLEETIATLKVALAEDYVNVADIANTLAKGNISVENATYEGLTVSMPYAALADAVGEDDKVYAPIVAAGTEDYEETDGEISYALDISLGVNGVALSTKPIVAQKVIVDLPATFDKSVSTVKVLHGTDEITADVVNGKAEFVVDDFSNFILVGTAATYDEDVATHTTKATLTITQDDPESNVFTLNLAPHDGQIIKYATGGYKVAIEKYDATSTEESAMENFTYELIPANGITITNETTLTPDSTELQAFSFVASATDRENLITVEAKEENDVTLSTGLLPIAKLVINGTGDLRVRTYGLVNENSNISKKFYMEKFADNDSVKADITEGSLYATIKEKKFNIDFNVDFNLHLQEDVAGTRKNNAEYLDITIELKNDITGDVYTLMVGEGTDENVTYLPVTYNAESSKAEGSITLPANATYSYKISGLGFRTFRGSVYVDENKTINLWNNALTSAPVNVVDGDTTTAKTVTFLVGDIYEDGIVDIYDLSAVTAYFGQKDIEADSKYVNYDLDRDGQISVQDIAWVQYSYGN